MRGVERGFLVGVARDGGDADWPTEESLNELRQLATTAGATVVGQASQRLRAPHPRTFIGAGKVAELARQRAEEGIDLYIFDDELTPSQARNLESELGAKVIDRTGLVLDIFGQRARTYEGRLQVQLAQYDYLLPRLTGQWTHLSRQEGGVGARGGPGETQLEIDRRRVRSRIADLKRDLDRVRQTRGLHRERRASQSVAMVSLVGYTNAGKSTLLNALTGAGVLAEDKLFATLDPTTRRVRLPSGREVVFSDTVGFIQKLPSSVVAAFRATLEELGGADLLVHVVDASHSDAFAQADEVDSVIASLDLVEKPVITALNKIDRVADDWPPQSLPETIDRLRESRDNAILIAAANGRGLDDLLLAVDRALAEDLDALVADIPYVEGHLVNLWRTRGSIETEEYQADCVRVVGRLPRNLLHRFERYRVRVPNTRAGRRGTGSRSR
ncbi:MAG: GTPase HflX [Chloroflexota bacterium]|nr:MAG: GTPase HflX [Chloroflexota bacterium]